MEIATAWLPIGAVLRRELLTLLRRHAAMAGLATVLAASITGVWMMTDSPYGARSFSSTMFRVGVTWIYLLSLVLVPALGAAAIASERQNNTLDLLLLTLAHNGAIVAAKVTAALGMFVLLCIGVLPIFGVMFFYVGVEMAQFLEAVAIILSATVAHAALGVAAAASPRTTAAGAVLRGVLLAVLISAGLLPGFIIGPLSLGGPGSFTLALVIAPFVGLARLFMAPAPVWQVAAAVIYQLVLATMAMRHAARALARHGQMNPVRDPPRQPVAPARSQVRKHPDEVTLHFRDGANPVYVKEAKMSALSLVRSLRAQPSLGILASLLVCAVFLFLGLSNTDEHAFRMRGVIYAIGWILAAITPAVTCSSMVRERRAPTYLLLRMSLVTPMQIMTGHVLATLRHVLTIFAAGCLAVAGVMLTFAYPMTWPMESPLTLALFLATTVVQFPILAAIGGLAGTIGSTLPRALMLAYLCTLLYTLIPTAIGLCDFYFMSGTNVRTVSEMSPFYKYATKLLSPPINSMWNLYDQNRYELFSGRDRFADIGWLSLPLTFYFHAVIWWPICWLAGRVLERQRDV